jgi:hypothetical protein
MLFQERPVKIEAVLRIVILVFAGAAMAVGVAIMAGLLVPRTLPPQFRIPIGAVVFLYAAYRFVVAYLRTTEARRDETR